MRAQYIYRRPTRLLCLRQTGPYDESITIAWRKMRKWLTERRATPYPESGYGLVIDDPRTCSPAACRYDACVVADVGLDADPANGIRSDVLPGGTYARVTIDGDFNTIGRTFSNLRRNWLPAENMSVDPTRFFVEYYCHDPEVTPQDQCTVELLVPVVPSVGYQTIVRPIELPQRPVLAS